jgi:hypothetical protein
VTLRPVATWIVYGDPLYVFPFGPEFGLRHALGNLPTHLLALAVFVPGGLLGALLYRGERRAEVLGTVFGFWSLFLFFEYSGQTSSLPKRLILGTRYFIPLTPWLAFACGETFPRLWARALEAFPAHRERLGRLGSLVVTAWLVGVVLIAFAVHPAVATLAGAVVPFREAIYRNTDDGALVMMDLLSSTKLVNNVLGPRDTLDLKEVSPGMLPELAGRYDEIVIALLDRNDSRFWRQRAEANAALVASLRGQAELELLGDESAKSGERLRIWRVRVAPSP